jgi:hypothetical protein
MLNAVAVRFAAILIGAFSFWFPITIFSLVFGAPVALAVGTLVLALSFAGAYLLASLGDS